MRILIAGGGRVGGVLAAKLVGEQHQVTVVERDRAVSDRLFEEVGALVVCGDAMDPQVLESAGIVGADVACALLPRDADNLAFAMLVRAVGGARTMIRCRCARSTPAVAAARETFPPCCSRSARTYPCSNESSSRRLASENGMLRSSTSRFRGEGSSGEGWSASCSAAHRSR